jgi:hypothetical protein
MTRQKTSVARKLGNPLLVVLILPIALPLALVALALHFLLRAVLYLLVWLLWIPKGKDRPVRLLRQPNLARVHDFSRVAASAGARGCLELVGA